MKEWIMSALSISSLMSFFVFIHSPYTLKDLSRCFALLWFLW
ncbi:hypothetical protein HPHPA8_0793 [Helicobacter pylori Hp A-8]|nr:hypothetical protein HPHPA8_0793 [Helicobacter pylori Hp A-8]